MSIPSEKQNILLHNTNNGAIEFHVNLTETTREKSFDSSAGTSTSYVILNTCSVLDCVKEFRQLCLAAAAVVVGGRNS